MPIAKSIARKDAHQMNEKPHQDVAIPLGILVEAINLIIRFLFYKVYFAYKQCQTQLLPFYLYLYFIWLFKINKMHNCDGENTEYNSMLENQNSYLHFSHQKETPKDFFQAQ